MFTSTRFRKLPIGCCALVAALASSPASADDAPPVEIKMSPLRQPATNGQPFSGVFEVQVYRAGTLTDYDVKGQGWTITTVGLPATPTTADVGVLRIPFTAVPTDADRPFGLTLRWNGRRVSRSFGVGPDYFNRAGKPHAVRHVGVQGIQDVQPPQDDPAPASGDPIPIRVTGRWVYDRVGWDVNQDGDLDDPEDIQPVTVGVDAIRIRVLDNDPVGTETIWSGFTDTQGYFDTGVVMWDDCDEFGCDAPDLIVQIEAFTEVVDVTDSSITEDTYTWETEEIVDFEGSFYDFGQMAPADNALMPSMHIFNSIVRVHRFIQTRTGLDTPHVQVEWPDDSLGNAGANYQAGPVEIHIGPTREWDESAHTHEYGHHFLHSFSVTVSPDYCNGWCDGEEPCTFDTECPDKGHCVWCPETDHDAWNEGWPNWLADVVLRSYPDDYVFDDGTEYLPLFFRSQENIDTCCVDDEPSNAPLLTEGYVGALLRDIEDDTQDDHDGDGFRDSLCLGVDEIFNIVVSFNPTTMGSFMNQFRSFYPEHASLLWPTAFNVDPDFAEGYPVDTDPPGVVQAVESPTHPIGVGNPLPCMTVEWDHAPDVGRGTCDYSYNWTDDPAGLEPDLIADPWGHNGCKLTGNGGSIVPSDLYFSIRAQDCSGNWSPDWATFGPFTVTDCDGTGILDLCDIDCAHPGYPGCALAPSVCFYEPGCGLATDCQPNLAPDTCDLADGTSEDCNQSAAPDECETIFHWEGDSGLWNEFENWEEEQLPIDGSDVCIDVLGDVTVTVKNANAEIGVLACEENFTINASTLPWPDITLNAPSWIAGNFSLIGKTSWLRVNDRLDLYGAFNWTGTNDSNVSHLTGSGETHVYGQMQLASNVPLVDHTLVLESGSTSVSTGRLHFDGTSTVHIMPGATFDYQGTSTMFEGGSGDLLINQGTIIKSASISESSITVFIENESLVHVQQGTLFFWRGSNNTGTILAAPGAAVNFHCGNHNTQVGSTIEAETVEFSGSGCGSSVIRGTYNVSDLTFVDGPSVTFTDEADIISYGQNLTANSTVTFNAVVGSTIQFDAVTISGAAHFNSGDPIEMNTLNLAGGSIQGPSEVTVHDAMTWGPSTLIKGPGVTHVNGTLFISSGGGVKTLHDRTLNLAGQTTMQGGFQMNAASELNNLPTGVIDIQFSSGGATIGGGTDIPFNNQGTLIKTGGDGTSTISTPVWNTGTVEIQVGTLQFEKSYVQSAGQTVLNGGTLAMWWPTQFIPAVQLDGGLLTGSGLITSNQVAKVNNAAATVAPGLSIGTITIEGRYNQYTDGTLEIEIAGTNPGEYDTLEMTANADLAGHLVVTEINGFIGQPGDSFIILTAADVIGTFDTLDLPSMYEISYNSDNVTMVIALTGDIDNDGDIDVNDYGVFQTCFDGPGNPPHSGCPEFADADLDNDGDVDLDDYGLFFAAAIGGSP